MSYTQTSTPLPPILGHSVHMPLPDVCSPILNDDVVREIFAYFATTPSSWPYKGNKEDRVMLARLARTCRGFTVPALDALWRTMCDLLPLLKILESSFKESDGTYVLEPDISTQEWQRLLTYSRRIRTLRVNFPNENIETSILLPLRGLSRGSLLFPALQVLQLELKQDNLDLGVLAFISPNLLVVDITFHPSRPLFRLTRKESKVFDQFFCQLFSSARCLKDFQYLGVLDSRCLQTVRDVPPHLERLDCYELDGGALPMSFLESCATARGLTEVAIMINQDLAACTGFPAVEDLCIYGNISDISRFIQNMSSMTLSKLMFCNTHRTCDGLNHHTDLYKILALRYHSTLTSMMILSVKRLIFHSPETMRILDFMHPLLHLHQLEEFMFHDPDGIDMFSITSQDIQAMAAAWPRMKELRIVANPADENPTVYDLYTFARMCPQLQCLHLPTMDVQTLQPFPLEHNLVRHDSLTQLTFSVPPSPRHRNVDFLHPIVVGYFLDVTFPSLEADSEEMESKYWADALTVIRCLRTFREVTAWGRDMRRNFFLH